MLCYRVGHLKMVIVRQWSISHAIRLVILPSFSAVTTRVDLRKTPSGILPGKSSKIYSRVKKKTAKPSKFPQGRAGSEPLILLITWSRSWKNLDFGMNFLAKYLNKFWRKPVPILTALLNVNQFLTIKLRAD